MLATPDELAEWQLAMATAILAMLPPVAVVVLMQRLFVRGLVEKEQKSSDGERPPPQRQKNLCRRLRGHQGHRFRRRRRPVLRAGRPFRLRQVHAVAHGRGARDDIERRDRYPPPSSPTR